MTGTCATCGNPMPYRRNDGTGLKRRFCSKRCGYGSSTRITINDDRGNVPVPVPMGSWWLDQSPSDFYRTAKQRFPEDAGDKSSVPVRTFGAYDPGFGERARRAVASGRVDPA